MNEEQIKHMVDRFLGWKLPQDFEPDSGISFNRYVNGKKRRQDWWPIGTNLFTATQAEAMIKYLVEDLPEESPPKPLYACNPDEGCDHAAGYYESPEGALLCYYCGALYEAPPAIKDPFKDK